MESITVCEDVSSRLCKFLHAGVGVPLDLRHSVSVLRPQPGADDWPDLCAQLAWAAVQWLSKRRVDVGTALLDAVVEPGAVRLEMRGYLWPRFGNPVVE